LINLTKRKTYIIQHTHAVLPKSSHKLIYLVLYPTFNQLIVKLGNTIMHVLTCLCDYILALSRTTWPSNLGSRLTYRMMTIKTKVHHFY